MRFAILTAAGLLGLVTARLMGPLTTAQNVANAEAKRVGAVFAFMLSTLAMILLVRVSRDAGGELLGFSILGLWGAPLAVIAWRVFRTRLQEPRGEVPQPEELERAFAMLAGAVISAVLFYRFLAPAMSSWRGIEWLPLGAIIGIGIPVAGMLIGLLVWRAAK